jgi:hypothetical protein
MKFGYTILYVKDVEKTVAFYESAFSPSNWQRPTAFPSSRPTPKARPRRSKWPS